MQFVVCLKSAIENYCLQIVSNAAVTFVKFL